MKNRIKISLLLSIAFFANACTDKFQEYNTNPMGYDREDPSLYLIPMQQSIYFNYDYGSSTNWQYQLIQNLNADIYSGYLASASNFAGGVNNQTYALIDGWNRESWVDTYRYFMTNSLNLTGLCNRNPGRYDEFIAINNILKVLAMSRVCDQYGPIIYSQYGVSKTGGGYDSAQDAYKQFFKDLEFAVEYLDNFTKENPDKKTMRDFDMAYGGDYIKWIKFSNSLRLRLAMRIVKYDANLAKQKAEEALAAPHGLITENEGNFTLSGFGYNNPLYGVTQAYNDNFISANIVSILGGYNDPRLEKYCTKNSEGKIVGMRTGIPNLDKNNYKPSLVYPNITAETPAILFTAAETHFLMAEAALRGWSGFGDVKTLYNKGIEISFAQWSANGVSSYLTSSGKPANFEDLLQSEANSPAVSTITPNWDDAKNNEEKLEKIITQKWIATFPEGMNPWAEWRRTSYPKLFPIIKNDSQGVIPTGLGVRRLPFPSDERTSNLDGYNDGVVKLGGPDNGATRLFWDINKGNF